MKNFFFLLLVIFLPMQLGIHFWPEWALVNGIRIDYFAPTLYFTDVLVAILIVWEIYNSKFEIRNQFSNFKFKISNWRGITYLMVGLFSAVFVYLNISHSLSPAVSAYKWIKILEFGAFGYFAAKNLKFEIFNLKFLLIPIFLESVLTIWQFWAQSSIGGMWYFLGERTFNSSTPGIANAYFNGQLLMRPYGTFSHPNVLGGFLAICLPICLVYTLRKQGAGLLREMCGENAQKFGKLVELGKLGIIILGYGALFLSLSRSAIFFGVVASLIVALPFLKRFKKIWPIGFIGLIGAVYLVWPRITSLKLETEPIVVREQLNELAVRQFLHSPVLGTGLGTAPLYQVHSRTIKNYALQFQPTHNVYLLALAETGVLGFGVLGVLGLLGAFRLYKRKDWILLTSLLSIAVLSLFDHYFLTLQQGQLIFVFVLALANAGGPSTPFHSAQDG